MRDSLPTDCWSSVTGARASSLIADMRSSSRFFSSSRLAGGHQDPVPSAILDQPAGHKYLAATQMIRIVRQLAPGNVAMRQLLMKCRFRAMVAARADGTGSQIGVQE
jgi:hypothetical protein